MTVACGLWPAVPADPPGDPHYRGQIPPPAEDDPFRGPARLNLVFSAVDSSARPNDGWPSRSAADHLMSPSGTSATSRKSAWTSAFAGEADMGQTQLERPSLTQSGCSWRATIQPESGRIPADSMASTATPGPPIATDHCGCGPIPPLRSRRARRSLTHLPSALSSNA